MNPYVSFGLAMCGIVGLSLALTAYMAVYFNRRAKADTLAALTPLAELIEGLVELDDAFVSGRYQGHIAEGRIALAPGRTGRIFQTTIIDAAGGVAWIWTATLAKEPGSTPEISFPGEPSAAFRALAELVESQALPLLTDPGWLQVVYDPGAGHLRLSKPMRTRRDIPDASLFRRQLDLLVEIGDANREVQAEKDVSAH